MSPRDSEFARWPTHSPPRRVDGGLKARSSRGAIGESWWSRRFLDILESFALGTRLTRGRSYARAGQVVSLTIGAGVVDASVQGSRPRPYHVEIGLDPFSDLVWATVEVALVEQALFSAQLLSGEVPQSLDDVFAAAGAPLFPRALTDLRMRCSCPDAAVPCKHIAATFYLLAEAFDADPFQILAWRGRDRETLLSRLRTLRAGDGHDTPNPPPRTPQARPAAQIGAAAALVGVTGAALADTVDRFWQAPVPLPGRRPSVDAGADLLIRQLPPPGRAIGGTELAECLRSAYQQLGRRAVDGRDDEVV